MVPTTYVFVDFGDNFPAGGLTTTVGAVRDVQFTPLAGLNFSVQGPQLTDANNKNYADGTAVTLTRFANTAAQRAGMMAAARGAFAGLDVTVVELTATGQALADGRSVAGAATIGGVTAAVRGNGTLSKDVYVLVAMPAIGASNDNPNTFAANGYGGISPTGTIMGEMADLQSSFNRHDDLVLSFRNDANTIVHEAGHALGVQHAVTTPAPAGSAINNMIHESEAMSYRSGDSSLFFSRYPMVRGDTNTDPQTSGNPPVTTLPPLSNNDLAARQGQQTPFDQLRGDPNVGAKPNLNFVSGTGANDIITISKNPGDNQATVSVQAFQTFAAGNYTQPIRVPGAGQGGTAYSYQISLDRPILVQGGLRDDRVVLAGNLGVGVTVVGQDGDDTLVLSNTSQLVSQYDLAEGVALAKIGSRSMLVQFSDAVRLTVEAGRRDVVRVNGARPETPVTVFGGESVALNIAGVQGRVLIDGDGKTALTVTDVSSKATQWRVFGDSIFANPGGFTRFAEYRDLGSMTVTGNNAGNEFEVFGTPAAPLTLNTGTGKDRVFLQESSGDVFVRGQSGRDQVRISSFGTTQRIRGSVVVDNTGSYTDVTVDDSADTVARTGILYKSGADHVLTGLTPAGDIILRTADLRSVSILAGSGNNTFRLHDTPGGVTTLAAGLGVDKVTVNGTTGPLTVTAQGGRDAITVGSDATGLDRIQGAVTVGGPANGSDVTLFDRPTAASRVITHTVTATGYTRTGAAAVNLSNVRRLDLLAGQAQDTVNVRGNPTPAGFDSFVIRAGGGNDVVNVGTAANTLAPIVRVAVDGEAGTDGLTLSDQGRTAAGLYTFGLAEVPFVSTVDAVVTYANAESLVFNGGGGGNTVNVQALAVPTTIDPGTGGDRVAVGTPAGSLADILSLNITDRGGVDQLVVRDQGATTARRYDLTISQGASNKRVGTVTAAARTFDGKPASSVRYDQIESVTLDGGGQGNLIRVAGTPSATAVAVHAGAGDDTATVASINSAFGPLNALRDVRGPLAVDGQGGADVVTFRDGGDPAARNYTLSPTTLARADAPAAPIAYANAETVAVGGSGGDNVFTLTTTQLPAGVSLDGGGGRNTLDYSAVGPATVPGLVARHAAEGDAADAVGGNDGTLVNGADFADGRVGQAFRFDGENDYVYVPNSPSLESPTVSVEAWVNSSDPGGVFAHIVAKGASGVAGASYALYTGSANGLIFYIFDGQNLVESPDAGPGVWDGAWHHVVGSFDGTTVRLYVDGAEVGGGTATAAAIAYGLPTGDDLVIGTYPADLTLSYRGRIDEPAVYDRALTAVEVQSLAAGPDAYGQAVLSANGLLSFAQGMAVAADGTIYVGNAYQTAFPDLLGGIVRIDPVTGAETLFSSAGPSGSVTDVLVEPNGHLVALVVSGTDGPGPSSGIVRVDPVTGVQTPVSDFNDPAQGPTATFSYGLAREAAGTYLATSGDRVFRVDPATGNRTVLSTGVAIDGSIGIAVEADGSILVVSYRSATLVRIDPVTGAQQVLATGLGAPVSVRVSGTGAIFVTDNGPYPGPVRAGRVLSIDPATGAVGVVTSGGLVRLAYGLAVEADGSILVSGSGANPGDPDRIIRLTPPVSQTGVVVNLQLGTASGLMGGIARIQNVIGSSGDDILVGNGGNALTGGDGRDLLIAGGSPSTLNGGVGEDILIAGTTNYDLNPAALLVIRGEWTRTDADYVTRVANLKSGTNGVLALNATTVHSNGGGNLLDGGSALDLFFVNLSENGLDTFDGDPLSELFVPVFVD